MEEVTETDKEKTIEVQPINYNNSQSDRVTLMIPGRAADNLPVRAAAILVLQCFNPPSCVHHNVTTMSREFGGDRLATSAMRAVGRFDWRSEPSERRRISRPLRRLRGETRVNSIRH